MTAAELWKEYKREHPESADDYEAWSFGDSAEMADELLELVLTGDKTATCCNYTLAKEQGEDLAKPGQLNILLDGQEKAKAIIETTHVEVVRFNEVTEAFARLEGEGDLSLSYWRQEHEAFFTREWKEAGGSFSSDMLVFCEVFKVVHRRD
ncbi:ASCH domain-containing protein [Alkalicoccobacillus murimartini]|uniref:Uncharacterized protein YhfF n=1 Tax=Alkalicoccobacillus murimartini TaxID=171685 RepID=A0ABT9YIZ6_9BACI|nr:ASCH domain-containing protein [Alkalicoccobacillus murimartini]MDQ0207686.1 uncharacterized protein YhfF [Alkalicoccobacillus murimartini]